MQTKFCQSFSQYVKVSVWVSLSFTINVLAIQVDCVILEFTSVKDHSLWTTWNIAYLEQYLAGNVARVGNMKTVKVKLWLCVPRGRRGIDPLILNLGARGRLLVNLKTPSPHPQERSQAPFELEDGWTPEPVWTLIWKDLLKEGDYLRNQKVDEWIILTEWRKVGRETVDSITLSEDSPVSGGLQFRKWAWDSKEGGKSNYHLKWLI